MKNLLLRLFKKPKSIKISSCNPPLELDAQEERNQKIENLKSKVFNLVVSWYEWNGADHPKDQGEREKKLKEIYEELIERMQDYETFMWDYREDWDLNFDDYNEN